MTLEKSEPKGAQPPNLGDFLRQIEKSAEAAREDPQNIQLLTRLSEGLDALLLINEETKKAQKLQNEIENYVGDLREELADIMLFRRIATTMAGVMSAGFFILVYCLVTGNPTWFAELKHNLQVPLLVSLITASVVILAIFLKGVYRSRHDRNMGDMIPETVKVALEAVKSE